jgi:hypothetical protein
MPSTYVCLSLQACQYLLAEARQAGRPLPISHLTALLVTPVLYSVLSAQVGVDSRAEGADGAEGPGWWKWVYDDGRDTPVRDRGISHAAIACMSRFELVCR